MYGAKTRKDQHRPEIITYQRRPGALCPVQAYNRHLQFLRAKQWRNPSWPLAVPENKRGEPTHLPYSAYRVLYHKTAKEVDPHRRVTPKSSRQSVACRAFSQLRDGQEAKAQATKARAGWHPRGLTFIKSYVRKVRDQDPISRSRRWPRRLGPSRLTK